MNRAVRLIGGIGLILIGILLLVLPGPGLLTIFAGISLVAGDSEWAARLLARVRGKGDPKKKAAASDDAERRPDSKPDDQTG